MNERQSEGALGWRAGFGPRTWWRHFVWLSSALAAGGAALYFIYAERWSIAFTRDLMHRSPYLPALIAVSA